MGSKENILVIGCGCIGLSSGIILLQAGYNVTIWAKDLPPNVTSNKAAALWYPFLASPPEKVGRWSNDTLTYFLKNILNDKTSGTLSQTVYEVFKNETPENPEWASQVPSFRRARKDELPHGYKDGFAVDAFIMDTDIYMDWLVKKFVALGGKIEQRTVYDIREPLIYYNVVINCPGLGAREVVNDYTVYPCRGQIIVIKHSGLTNSLMYEEGGRYEMAYAIPRLSNIVIGGTVGDHEYHMHPNPQDEKEILEKVAKLSPKLKDVEIVQHKVGLRPARDPIRLEPEWQQDGRKLVVHNYGHGGSGFTVSWGCALEVLQIVDENVKKIKKDNSNVILPAKL
eukprot:TRINITY_DN2108_c0_g2_i1.p1 TRINITY_DN2108_c0_g2~~TRINITY_DN2108_c0_g2_i1.p1  ORF type:complete len:340 (-),score=65.46 TRINITY_DN2108_c0_g2_i1:46-1065(-)